MLLLLLIFVVVCIIIYFAVARIKPSSDGPANCFSFPGDTQIQRLRQFVHTTTASRRVAFAESFVNRASDLVDRVKLLANDSSSDGGGTRQKVRCHNLFLGEMGSLSKQIDPIAKDFLKKADKKIMHNLKPSLTTGARKAHSSAMYTVNSWGSKCRRRKNERTSEQNGLYWSTYFATVRREGVYVSASAGSIDLNAELAEPMEAEYTPAWQSIMDGAIRNLISESERQVVALCKQLDQALLNEFCSIGIDKARIASMISIAASNCTNTVRASFSSMRETATENQRELSRSLLPKVQQSMKGSYAATINVPGGTGKFGRMKNAMNSSSREAVNGVFDEFMKELLNAIERMVQDLSERIDLLKENISKSPSSVYSILWEDQNAGMAVDPAHQRRVLACRAACLPLLNQLRAQQDEVMQILGIERPVLDLEIAAVESWEQKNAKNMQAAIASGAFMELLDDSDDDVKEPTGKISGRSVKQEKGNVKCETSRLVKNEMRSPTSNNSANGTINLLNDSDDDDDYDDDNADFDIRCTVAKAGELGISFEKVSEGFFINNIEIDSQLAGKVFLGDILKSIDGKRLSDLDHDHFTKELKESNDKQKRRIYLLRSKITIKAKAGGLGLAVNKVSEGFVVSKINRDSQLAGKVMKDDILISIDGTRLSVLGEIEFSREVQKHSQKSKRRICILRKKKNIGRKQLATL